MGNSQSSKPKQKKQGVSLIIKARSLLSNGDEGGALAVLREEAQKGNVMACYDCGFLMIQGIGCEKDKWEGLELLEKGWKLEQKEDGIVWRSDGSATDVLGPQSMNLSSLLFLNEF